MDLILIRHPAVDIDAGICYGATDVPLLCDAAESARTLGERLLALNVPPVEGDWHTSPLSRCRLLAEALGPVHVDGRLQELDFGSWKGNDGMVWIGRCWIRGLPTLIIRVRTAAKASRNWRYGFQAGSKKSLAMDVPFTRSRTQVSSAC